MIEEGIGLICKAIPDVTIVPQRKRGVQPGVLGEVEKCRRRSQEDLAEKTLFGKKMSTPPIELSFVCDWTKIRRDLS